VVKCTPFLRMERTSHLLLRDCELEHRWPLFRDPLREGLCVCVCVLVGMCEVHAVLEDGEVCLSLVLCLCVIVCWGGGVSGREGLVFRVVFVCVWGGFVRVGGRRLW
jgi:hypothetical protein